MAEMQTMEELMGMLAEIANGSDAFGIVECTVRGKRSIALVKRENETAGSMDVIPIMVAVTEELKVKPLKDGMIAFPHYQKPN